MIQVDVFHPSSIIGGNKYDTNKRDIKGMETEFTIKLTSTMGRYRRINDLLVIFT